MEFNEETKAQIIAIQMKDIVNFCENIAKKGYITMLDVEKIDKMFKIVNNNEPKASSIETIEPDSNIIL